MGANDFSPDPTGRMLWYLIPLGTVVVLIAVGLMTVGSLGGSGDSSDDAGKASTVRSDLPDYWTVKPGQTFSTIAGRTGLTVEQLESFNPRVDPSRLTPGGRVKLREDVAKPRPEPRGPRFRTVRSGESFGSIAEDTGRSIITLRRLNPNLKPSKLQPGDRMRLRR